eukprot:PITA_04267
MNDHFPLPFIDQVLDDLARKRFFSFLDGLNRYNQIQISLEDQDKTTFTCPLGTFAYRVLSFGLSKAAATFQRAVLSIFSELVHDVVEIYMDDFTPYGSHFQEDLSNLGKVIEKCIEMKLSLSPEKCEFLMTEGTMLGHAISQQGLQVDPNKIAIIQRVPPPQKFDLTIIDKPGKENVVANFLSRVNLPTGEEGMVDDQMVDEHLFSLSVLSAWFVDIANYLVLAQFLPHLSSKQKSKIVRKSAPFTWIGGNLFKHGLDQILKRWIREEEVFHILQTCHDRPCGSHFAAKRTTFKILQAGYYWPTLHQDGGDIPASVISLRG